MTLTPDWVVGFVDGEGCFFVGIQRNPSAKIGFQVIPEFRVVQHSRDLDVLHALKRFFGFGRVCQNHGDRYEFRVRRIEQLKVIASFFDRNQLRTKKRIDARKFADVLRMMDEHRHLTEEGLRDIARLATSMNTGNRPRLSEILEVDEDRVQSGVKASE
jgi:LAGLIDADG endonuclease